MLAPDWVYHVLTVLRAGVRVVGVTFPVICVLVMGFLLTIVHIWTNVVRDVGGWCRSGGLFLVLSDAPFNPLRRGCNSVFSFRVIENWILLAYCLGISLSAFVDLPESGLGPPPLGDYLPPTSVLHRLSAELYSLSFSALSTWGVLRRFMAAGGSDWPAVLSEELLEGFSSLGKEGEGTSSEATTSARVVSRLPAVPKRWAVYSYFSKFSDAKSLGRIRSRYQVPEDVVLRIPNLDEQACSHVEDVTLYESTLTASLRFPIQPFIRELLDFLSLAPGQVAPNGWRVIISSMIAASPGFWMFRNRDNLVKLVEGLPSSNRGWKDGYFFVCGDNWERLPEEALDRPTVTPVWKDCILRVHSLSNRQYMHYIQSELLFRHSFGPKPSAVVLSLIQTNEKTTMKINKSKLKNMVEKGALAAPISIKWKRIDEGQSSAIDNGPTICRSHGLAAKRAEAAVMELDFQEYASAWTKNISKLMVHSLMRSLNEVMVISCRCLSVEDDLVCLKQRLVESEASQKSLNQAVFKLNKEKKDLLGVVEAVKVELLAKEGDVKAAMDACDEAVKEMKHLMAFWKQAKEKYPNIDFTEFQPYDDTDLVNDGGEKVNDAD
uniref:Uncharacterized protein n=1 Tax=Fagus sylvatica TaxID=28930 RepID=A0A2N9GFW8_FAGSY